MRKFRGRIQQQQQQQAPSTATVPIPQICVDDDDDDNDDNGHVAILDEFDQVLENELKRTSVLRTSSLKQKEMNTCAVDMSAVAQQRSFSFALGSSSHSDGRNHVDDDEENEPVNSISSSSSSSKTAKIPSSIKASLSKETFSRLLHSLAFRSGHHTTSKITTITSQDCRTQQQACLACQNLDLLPKYKKRPSIFGVLVSKLNTPGISSETPSNRCPSCKRRLSKSIFYNSISSAHHMNDDESDGQQLSPPIPSFSSSSFTSAKLLHEHGPLLMRTKRRRSLPSLFHSLFDFDHHDKRHLDAAQLAEDRPSFSSIMTHTLMDSITREQHPSLAMVQPTSPISFGSISLAGSDDSEEQSHEKSSRRQLPIDDDSSELTEKVSKSAKTRLSLARKLFVHSGTRAFNINICT